MTQHLSAFRRSPGMPSWNPRFPRNSLVKNTGLDITTLRMKVGKDNCFPTCDVMYCGTHTPADSSSMLTADKNLKTSPIHWVKIRIRVHILFKNPNNFFHKIYGLHFFKS